MANYRTPCRQETCFLCSHPSSISWFLFPLGFLLRTCRNTKWILNYLSNKAGRQTDWQTTAQARAHTHQNKIKCQTKTQSHTQNNKTTLTAPSQKKKKKRHRSYPGVWLIYPVTLPLEKVDFSLSQKISIANGFLFKGRTVCPLSFFSILVLSNCCSLFKSRMKMFIVFSWN